ncbi:MAG: hypothetical protein AABY27_03095 [Pseudomonadota bacterium]
MNNDRIWNILEYIMLGYHAMAIILIGLGFTLLSLKLYNAFNATKDMSWKLKIRQLPIICYLLLLIIYIWFSQKIYYALQPILYFTGIFAWIAILLTACIIIYKSFKSDLQINLHCKIRKSFIVIPLALLLFYWNHNTNMMTKYNGGNSDKSRAMSQVITNSFGIEHHFLTGKLYEIMDVMHFKPEELEKKSCIGIVSGKKKLASLKECLQVDEQNIEARQCDYSDDCISIRINGEYYLNHLNMLNKVIEIAKRPCDFVPSLDKFSEYIKHQSDKRNNELDFKALKKIRKELSCDVDPKKRKKEKIFITLKNQNYQNMLDIQVERKE